ncbi:F-box protein At2g27310 isoform X2 [Arachis hypogaea]|uniref:F-box protein At2g27310 isoform X2 n=1 Tax=Arachis hypogaea TaxID=3818 RepID=UPI0010FC5009|nr:F-box protein At2g27310 isoform X2 [Arachis hypogaea]
MSVAPVESIPSLSSDLFYEILRRLDGATLASAACTCAALCSISKEESLWENVCSSMWPSTNREDVKSLISSVGGFRKFYADSFPLIVNKDVMEFHHNNYFEYPDDWTEAEYYDSEGNNDGAVNLSISDGLPAITSMEREKKDGKLWKELSNGLRLSWIVVNRKIKQAANLSSWFPLGGQRHWPTDNDFVVRFGSILPAEEILPCQVVECILIMKFRVVHTESEGIQTSLKLTELSMQLEDMEGAHVNGRNSLHILKKALSCQRSKNYGDALESCHMYSKVQNELKKEKMRNENRLDRLCILSGIAAFMTFWYCVL